MNVFELTDAGLNYWVAKARGFIKIQFGWPPDYPDRIYVNNFHYSPSTDWSQGGPIIERERIQYVFRANHRGGGVFAHIGTSKGIWGETILIATMRCYVASVYWDKVPNEVLQQFIEDQ